MEHSGERDSVPAAVLYVLLFWVREARTLSEVQRLVDDATSRYTHESLGEFQQAVTVRRHELDPEGMDIPAGTCVASPELEQLWCNAVRSMERVVLDSFERRTFRSWNRAALPRLTAAIASRRQDVGPSERTRPAEAAKSRFTPPGAR